jgi:hypothetical protein
LPWEVIVILCQKFLFRRIWLYFCCTSSYTLHTYIHRSVRISYHIFTVQRFVSLSFSLLLSLNWNWENCSLTLEILKCVAS